MFKRLIRSIRRPLLRFLSQGDLIIIGDVHARPDRPLLAVGQGYAEVIGNISYSDNNFGCIVPPGYRDPNIAWVLPQVAPMQLQLSPGVSAGSVEPGPTWYMVRHGALGHRTIHHGDVVQMVEDPIMHNWLYRRDGTLHNLEDKNNQYLILQALSPTPQLPHSLTNS
jgi:hypothetical protein